MSTRRPQPRRRAKPMTLAQLERAAKQIARTLDSLYVALCALDRKVSRL